MILTHGPIAKKGAAHLGGPTRPELMAINLKATTRRAITLQAIDLGTIIGVSVKPRPPIRDSVVPGPPR
jgi:hypothetical protein